MVRVRPPRGHSPGPGRRRCRRHRAGPVDPAGPRKAARGGAVLPVRPPVLGERYCAEGFYGIMKLRNYRADYQRAVHRLAERIIEIGDESVAYADDDVQTAWSARTSNRCRARSGPPARGVPTDGQLQISVLAHDTSTLPPGRAVTTTAHAAHLEPVPAGLSRSRSPTTRWNWRRSAWTANRWSRPSRTARQLGEQRAPGAAEPVPGGCLGEHVRQHQDRLGRLTRSRSPGSAFSSRGTARTRERTRQEMISARICISIWGASWTACRAVARWPRAAFPRCRTSVSCCPR